MDYNAIIDKFDLENPDWSMIPPDFFRYPPNNLKSNNVVKYALVKAKWEFEAPKELKQKHFLPKSGGYRQLKSYQNAEIIHDFTKEFVQKYIDYKSRTRDQMEQAARSGKQNIAEGSMASGTSKRTEIKLVNVANASLAELLEDYRDYLRQHGLPEWSKDDTRAQAVRALAYKSHKSYATYKTYMTEPEAACNAMICLINQTKYLLDRQLKSLEQDYLKNGGMTDRINKIKKDKIWGRF